MRQRFTFILLFFAISSTLLAITGEYRFKVLNRPADQSVIGFTASFLPNTIVFDENLLPTTLYNTAFSYTEAGGIIANFDWFKDPDNHPMLAYGIYRIGVFTGKQAYFYFDLRDCYYGFPHPIEPPDSSDYVFPPLDMYFQYDFSADKFYGQRRIIRNDSVLVDYIGIDNGDTIGIWFVRPDYPDGCTACTECFNPKVYLTNEYGSYTNFGQLVLDDSLYVDSGDSAFIPMNTNHSVMSDQDKYVVAGDSVQQHHWDDYETDIIFKNTFSVSDWRVYKKSNFEKLNICTIQTDGSSVDSIEFKDPWLVEAGNTRPNDWHSYTTHFCPGNGYGVFLNENVEFDSIYPIYSLKAPHYAATTDGIYAFSGWTASPSANASFEDSSLSETAVVFKSAGVTVTANYSTKVSNQANYTATILADETLTIPAGAGISFADGFEIVVEGNFIAEGTESDRITFTGAGKADEYDEYACDPDHELLKITGDNSILTLGYLDITNTYGGITLNGNNLNVNIHDMKIEDSNVGILIGESLSNSEILIDGIVFENNNVAVNAGRRTAEMDQETNVYFVRSVFSNNDFNIFIDRWDEDDEYQSIQNYHCYRCDFIGGLTKVMSYGAVKENSKINLKLYQNIFYDYTDFHLSLANDVYSGSNIAYLVDDLSNMGVSVVDPQFINASICDYRLKSASPCIDAGEQIYGFDESETDPDGTTYDIGAYYFPQESLSGTIASDRSLFGRYNFQSNVTISSGATLTIDEGSVINGNDHNLYIYGILEVNGTSDNPVDISNTYLYCSSGGPVDMEYANISESPSKGLFAYNSQVILDHCNFTGNGNDGAYLSYPLTGSSISDCIFDGNSRYGTWVYKGSAFEISNNKFRNHTNYYGLALTEFNGSLYDNYFENNKYGIGFDKGNANLLCDRPNPWEHCGNPGDSYINNVIRNNSTYGIYILASSTPMIGAWQYLGSSGSQVFYRGGYNAFIDNDDVFVKYIKSLNSTTIDISSNFWDTGGGSVLSYVEGTFDEYPNWYISQTSLAKSRGDLGDFSEDEDYLSDHERTPLELELFLGDSLLLDSLYAEAFTVYDNLINTNPGQIDARTALNRIIYMFQLTDDNVGLQNYLDQILLKYPDKSVGILAYDYSSNRYEKSGDFQTSLNVNDQAGEKYENIGDLEGKAGALFENLITCEMVASDTVGENSLAKRTSIQAQMLAESYLDRILKECSQTGMAQYISELYGMNIVEEKALPSKFALKPAYPNPFNSKTTIAFDLPEEARVGIVVYDLMGREVWKSVKTNYSPGTYSVVWNGVNHSGQPVGTGMYLVKLNSAKYTATQKVLLMK